MMAKNDDEKTGPLIDPLQSDQTTSTPTTATPQPEGSVLGNLILLAGGALALLVGISVWLLLRQRGE